MIRLIAPFARRFGLGRGRFTIRFPESRLVTTSGATDTTVDTVNPKPDIEHTESSSAELDLDEYMNRARTKIGQIQNPCILVDSLSPRPSNCLSLALRDHLPTQCWERLYPNHTAILRDQGIQGWTENVKRAENVPPGHHLVYCPPFVRPDDLMSDGAEEKYCPGAPFVRRLWVGGSLKFTPEWYSATLDHRPFYCLEKVSQPMLRPGSLPGKEGVSVEIKRTYLLESLQLEQLYKCGKSPKPPPIEETRELVFLRQPSNASPEDRKTPKKSTTTITKSQTPDFSFELIPDNTLLFHFSALSYNAHAIHLNPEYARNVEGHEGLLVHGPLTLVLMLYALRAHPAVKETWMTKSIDYRNIRPLYVGKKLKVCVKMTHELSVDPEIYGTTRAVVSTRLPVYQRNWRVWIENEEGQVAVKAKAVTVRPDLEAAMQKAREKNKVSPTSLQNLPG
ncbi:hypothetical protein V8F20_002284 [Naviculisporaceae sp. PSN 640]